METKHASLGQEEFAVYHNAQISAGAASQPITVQQLFNVWSKILPGTNVNNRIGTEIFPRGLSLRLYLENVLDRPNVHWRIIIGCAPKQRSDGTVSTYDNLEILDAGSNGNLVRHTSNDLGYKIFYDKVFKNEQGISTVPLGGTGGKRAHKFVKIWIRRKKANKIIFNSAASGVQANIINKPFFFCVIPYDSSNTLSTDICGYINYQCKLWFKDA